MDSRIGKDAIDIHNIIYNGQQLYFIHSFTKNYDNMIESGNVFLIYKHTDIQNFHNHDRAVLDYKFVNSFNGQDYIELSNIMIDEEYRGKGLGSLILRYFENKIVEKYFNKIKYIKGILLLGEEKNLESFYIKNGYDVQGCKIIKKL